jgi:adenylate cyclase
MLILLPWLLLAALVYVHQDENSKFRPVLKNLQNYTFDTYQRLKPRENKPVEIYVVDIDEKSLKEVGQWPWPRNKIAELIESLFEKGVASVGLDIVFAEKDGKSPETVSNYWTLDPETQLKLNALPSHDDALAEVLRKFPVVAGFVASPGGYENVRSVHGFNPNVQIESDDGYIKYIMDGVLGARNIPLLEDAAQYHGYFGYYKDTDSAMVRHVPLFFKNETYVYPSLALATLNAAGEGGYAYHIETDDQGLKNIWLEGRFPIPVEKNGQYRVYYRKYIHDKEHSRYISATDILQKRDISQNLNAAIVLIGTSAAGIFDLRSTPLDPVVPGVESHIQMIESMYLGEHLTRPSEMQIYETYALFVLGVLLLVAVHFLGAFVGLFIFSILNTAILSGAAYFFINELVLIDISYVLIALFILYLGQAIVKYALERASKRAIRSAFGQYLSPDMVKIVSEDPSKLSLGGEDKEITVLFSDIRGFTTISEGLTPLQLTSILNRYLTPMTDIVQKNEGTIDKYMGDAVMAFWNAPLDVDNHAYKACKSALEMFEALDVLNKQLKEDALPQINIGIGIHTDKVTVGNMGSTQRFDYTVMGDGVNLGSRLESQCKNYGVNLIVSEAVLKKLQMIHRVSAMYLDKIAVKGKSEAVNIYHLISLEEPTEEVSEKIDLTKRAIDAFQATQWEISLDLFKNHSIPLKLRSIYVERINRLSLQQLPEDWDGIYHAQEK